MNAYKKNNAYAEAEQAYDYSVEERVSRGGSSYAPDAADSFEKTFYYDAKREESNSSGSGKPISYYFVDKKAEAEKKEAEEKEADLRPSVTTLQFLDKENDPYQDYRGDEETSFSRKFKINTKAKVFIALYALVILTILALIFINTALLRSVDETVAERQAQIQVLRDNNAELSATLSRVSDDAVIEERAAEMGMIKPE